MALTSAGRSSDHGLDVRFRKFNPDGVQFTLAKLTKTRSGPPKMVFFPTFQVYPQLCPVMCLKRHEQLIEPLRKPETDGSKQLFLSYVKPHKPIASATVASWLIETLKAAGIDTRHIHVGERLHLQQKIVEYQ